MSAYEDVGEYGAPGGYGDVSAYGVGRAAGHSPPGATTPGERDAPGARPMPGTGTGRPGARLPFAGRAAQLGALERALRRPSCRAAVITGAPGVGKSRLAEEFLTRARHRGGHRVLRVQATDAARAMPLSALAPLLPYDSEVDGPAGFFAEVRRRAAAHRATAGPTVLVVDDIHLLDPTSSPCCRCCSPTPPCSSPRPCPTAPPGPTRCAPCGVTTPCATFRCPR